MKIIYALLGMLAGMVTFTSCDDKDDAPKVNVNVEMTGVTRVGDTLYAVASNPIEIKSVDIASETSEEAVIGSVSYFWDGYRIGVAIAPPYGMTIDTADIPLGRHSLQLEMPIYAVGYSISTGVVSYRVMIVESEEDIPSGGDVQPDPTLKGSIVMKH